MVTREIIFSPPVLRNIYNKFKCKNHFILKQLRISFEIQHTQNNPKYPYFKIHTCTTIQVKFKHVNIKSKFRDIFLYSNLKQN